MHRTRHAFTTQHVTTTHDHVHKITLLLLATLAITPMAIAATVYVDIDNTGTEDGTSWATAYDTIQEGIDNASAGDTVLVEEGTYEKT